MDYREIITTDLRVRDGLPCIRGLPITVAEVIDYLASGMTIERILAKLAELTREDITACLKFAADSFCDSGGGAASVPHPISPKPPSLTAVHKKLENGDDA
jgi:uncharacterized protein (DUF433 family)